jgi:hypothetical protein
LRSLLSIHGILLLAGTALVAVPAAPRPASASAAVTAAVVTDVSLTDTALSIAADIDTAGATGLAGAAEETRAARPQYVPFAPGERLVFSIDYGPINAGEGVLEVLGLVDCQGSTCYEVESTATSNRFFSAIYKVRDRVTTHIDTTGLYPRFFEKRLREGNYRKHVRIAFDQEGGKAHYHDGRVFDTVPGIQDVLSAFYYVRTLDLAPGRTFGIMTHSSRKTYSLKVIVHGRETVEVPAGKFDCFVVEPVIQGEGLFQHEGKLTIWLTADSRRMPVLMKTKVQVGSIDASLKEYRPGTPPHSG